MKTYNCLFENTQIVPFRAHNIDDAIIHAISYAIGKGWGKSIERIWCEQEAKHFPKVIIDDYWGFKITEKDTGANIDPDMLFINDESDAGSVSFGTLVNTLSEKYSININKP